jgi:hypothetical protein
MIGEKQFARAMKKRERRRSKTKIFREKITLSGSGKAKFIRKYGSEMGARKYLRSIKSLPAFKQTYKTRRRGKSIYQKLMK